MIFFPFSRKKQTSKWAQSWWMAPQRRIMAFQKQGQQWYIMIMVKKAEGNCPIDGWSLQEQYVKKELRLFFLGGLVAVSDWLVQRVMSWCQIFGLQKMSSLYGRHPPMPDSQEQLSPNGLIQYWLRFNIIYYWTESWILITSIWRSQKYHTPYNTPNI
jgi:hypothetical protein